VPYSVHHITIDNQPLLLGPHWVPDAFHTSVIEYSKLHDDIRLIILYCHINYQLNLILVNLSIKGGNY
jgi:hypothetical protein